MTTLWRLLRGALLALAAVVLLIEEWGWRPLAAWAARLAAWPPLGRLEARIRGVRPGVALTLFLLPAVLLFPLKLVALWLIHGGRVGLGLAVIVGAKVVGTALVGRLFVLVEPQLRTFAWFVRVMVWWLGLKARLRTALHAWRPWRVLRRRLARGRTLWRTRRRRGAG